MLGTKFNKEKMMKTILLTIAILVGLNAEARTAHDAYRMGATGNLPAWGKISVANGITGTLAIANGGSGQTSANAALNAFLPSQATHAGKCLSTDGTDTSWATVGSGSVTSVDLSMPAEFTVSNNPVTTSGTLTVTKASQLQNLFFASPDGSSGAPTFRSIVAADVPTLNQNTTGTAASFTGNLTGDVTSTGMSTSISDATVTGKLLTGYSIGTVVGTVAATDSILQAVQKIAGNQRIAEFDDGNSGASDTIDFSNGPAHKSTLTGNCTFTFSNPIAGQAYVLKTVGDGTVRTITWPAAVKWAGGTAPTMTGTAGKFDLINFYYDGTNYLGSYTQNY